MKYLTPIIVILTFVITIFSCGSSEENELPLQDVQLDTLRYGKTAYAFPRVSNNVQEITANWLFYSEFETTMTGLKNLTLEELKDNTRLLLEYTDSIRTKLPDTLITRSIGSRIRVIKTRLKLLELEANKGRIDSTKIEMQIAETQAAVNNFVVQINEKFQKDGIDLQRVENEKKELEKQRNYLDSIQQLELRDQK